MKRKKIVLLGVFITVISLIALLLPLNVLFATILPQLEGSLSVDAPCIEEGETSSVTITMGGSTGGAPSGVKWKLEIDGSEVWRTPYMAWQTTSPEYYNTNLGVGSYTATLYMSRTFQSAPDNWVWTQVASEPIVVEECPEPEPEVGNITVVKRDPGGTLLAGAGFTVYYAESGNPAAPEGFTADSGMITFAGLPFGSYIVRETTAPAGFGLAPDQAVALASESVAVSVNFVDDPITTTTTTATTTPPAIEVLGITEELPFTGQSMWLYIIGAAMLALAGGLTFVLRAVRSKA